MKIAITGATGFVGTNLQDYLKTSHDIESMSVRYVPNKRFEIKGDVIIHLAGKAHDLKKVSNPQDYYAANFDKPHAFNFTGNYKFKHRYNLSINVTYSTGRPITLPIAKYNYGGSDRVYYSDRNAYRIPDYFRTDISFNIEGNHKVNQLTHNSWTIGVYNITGRQNAYSTYFTTENGVINGYKLSIFATALPFINYNIKF